MREPNDCRFVKQDRYLKGATVKWADYKAPSPEWDHDHCQFCWSKFMESGSDVLTTDYVTVDIAQSVLKISKQNSNSKLLANGS
jgi:hypothetical protein